MAKLEWDAPGSRLYESGLDRGVLYLSSTVVVPWNGLVSIDEQLDEGTPRPVYFDGELKRHSRQEVDYSATVKAFTYPDEFEAVQGALDLGRGLATYNQHVKPFHMSYRTLVGSDTLGDEAGYKIHILYNIVAVPKDTVYNTIQSNQAPSTFGWDLSGMPELYPGYAPTSHVIFDSRYLDPTRLEFLEDMLYGSAEGPPTLPSLRVLADYIQYTPKITIVDNEDGTWTAISSSVRIKMLDADSFEIIDVDGTYPEPGTYSITTTA